MCIAVNYIDTFLVICRRWAKFKPGIVGQSSCLNISNAPPGRLGRKVRFCIQVFGYVFLRFLKIVFFVVVFGFFGGVYAQPMFCFIANKI